MRKRIKVLLVLALACLALALALAILRPREVEPAYQGRTLSEWRAAMVQPDRSPGFSSIVSFQGYTNAVSHMGTNLLPYLTKCATYEPPKWRKPLDLLCEKFPTLRNSRLVYSALYKADDERLTLYRTVAILGTNAAPALQDLARIAANTQKPTAALRAQTWIGYVLHAYPSELLTNFLVHPDPIIRQGATNEFALRQYGFDPLMPVRLRNP